MHVAGVRAAWGKWCVCGLLVTLAGLLAAGPGRAQEKAPAEVEPATLLRTATPALREVLGPNLEGTGISRLGTEADLQREHDAELDAQIHCQFPDLQGPQHSRALAAAQEAVRHVTLANRPAGQEALLLYLDNARQMTHWDESLATLDSPA